MDLNKFTIKAQESLAGAQGVSYNLQHQVIEPSHVLKSLLNTDKNVAPYLFKKVGASLGALQKVLDKQLGSLAKVPDNSQQMMSQNTNQVLFKAADFAKKMKDEFVSVEHVLLALIEVKSTASQMLKDAGLSVDNVKKAIEELRGGEKVKSNSPENQFQALEKYTINLNEQAENGKLDPVIGRDDEIRRVLHILSRRTKNNPILVGEPGVGKTAIAEGIAHRIVNGDVPENLKSKILYSLDMGLLMAGTKFRGEFEERLKAGIKEITKLDGEAVLFIDEIHTLVGAGSTEGSLDAANLLKPALARGDLRAVGATTSNEYQKYFEKDKALARRFQKVMIDEPSLEDAISILRGLKEKYETHHKVRILDEAIISAVKLSDRYISDRFLPDKAIDLIDEASAKLRLEIDSVPVELDEIERKIRQLEIEIEGIKRENDEEKLGNLQKDLADWKAKRDAFRAKWKGEKDIVDAIQQTKKDIEEYRLQSEQFERMGDYGRVAELRYGKIKEAEAQLEKLEVELSELNAKNRMIKEEISAEDIASVVSKWTHIPLEKMLETERYKLLQLEAELGKRVVGQPEAITAVSDAIRRSRAGLQDPNRPIGSFIFLGMTGVGKTELAKALADYLFNDEGALVRIDMSEYQEKSSVSRLIGAPPGYVGYDEGGQLTEAVRTKPYSVVLLDEIEKAHPDTFNVLLQVLDDGRLTDNKGRTVNFKNTIVIMTSNIGSHLIQENFSKMADGELFSTIETTKVEVFDLMRKVIRPEFLNRIDETIMFKPILAEDLFAITQIQLNNLKNRLAEQDIHINVTEDAIQWLGEVGYEPQFGARPIKRLIQKEILNELSKQVISGKVNKGTSIKIDVIDDQLRFWNEGDS